MSRLALVALTLVAVLAGCGGEPSGTAGSSPSLTRVTTTEVGDGAEERTPPSEPETEPPTESETIEELIGFTAPDGNVSCMLDSTFVRCDIRDRDWELPPRPADCEFDYGQGIDLLVGEEPTLVCAGDTTFGGDGEPLAYGATLTAGPLACGSSDSGITCRDQTSGRGFTIHRQAYELF